MNARSEALLSVPQSLFVLYPHHRQQASRIRKIDSASTLLHLNNSIAMKKGRNPVILLQQGQALLPDDMMVVVALSKFLRPITGQTFAIEQELSSTNISGHTHLSAGEQSHS